MTSRAAALLGFLGFLLTMGGVGGIENSTANADLFSAMVVSCVGLCIMYCAVAALKVSEYYDEQ